MDPFKLYILIRGKFGLLQILFKACIHVRCENPTKNQTYRQLERVDSLPKTVTQRFAQDRTAQPLLVFATCTFMTFSLIKRLPSGTDLDYAIKSTLAMD